MNDREVMVYVSCAEAQEIVRFSLNQKTGALKKLDAVALTDALAPPPPADESGRVRASFSIPLALPPNRRFIYGVTRMAPFLAVSFAIDPGTGAISKIAEAPIPEYTPFITTDPTGRYLLGNAYHGNFVWVSAIEDEGRVLAPPIQIVENIRTSHFILVHPNVPCAYVAVTGDHEIRKYAFDVGTGHLTADGSHPIMAKPGSRPRHMALHPNKKFLYCNGETSANIAGYTVDETTGALTLFQDIDAWPANGSLPSPSTGADLQISPDGRFIYGSERVQSVISVYAIAQDGNLSYVETVEAEQVPRAFRIDPSGRFLISAGQNSGRIGVYEIDQTSGRLTRLQTYEAGSGATWVEFVELSPRG